MNLRSAVIAVAVAFGMWESADVAHTGAPAAVFAVLFLACAAWLWRRSSRIAAIVVAGLCTLEASQAHTWSGVGTAAKDAAMALGSAGIVAAAAYVVHARPSVHERSL